MECYEQHRRTDDMKLALKSMLELLKGEDFDEIRQVMLWALRITGRAFDENTVRKLRTLQEGPSALSEKITKAPVEPW